MCFVTHLIAFHLQTPPPSSSPDANATPQPTRKSNGYEPAAHKTPSANERAAATRPPDPPEAGSSASEAGSSARAKASEAGPSSRPEARSSAKKGKSEAGSSERKKEGQKPLALERLYSILSADRARRAVLVQATLTDGPIPSFSVSVYGRIRLSDRTDFGLKVILGT